MSGTTTNLLSIEKAIIETLKAEGMPHILDYDYQDLISGKMDQYKLPAIRVTCKSGNPKKFRHDDYNMTADISVILIIGNLKDNSSREFLISSLIDQVYIILTRNNMGLQISNGLVPGPFNDTTQLGGATDFQAAGYLRYELKFMAQYFIPKLERPEFKSRGRLKKITMAYDANNDGIPELEQEIDFTEIDGGDASTINFCSDIDGGFASTTNFTIDYDGGNADTDFNC